MLPSWTWPLLQSAYGPLNQPSLILLSWDSFSLCPSADMTVARPHQTAFLRRRPSAARFHTFCKFRPRGFSPPRRFAPRDGFGCIAIQASQGSLRCQQSRPPPPGKPDPEARDVPFPQRGHPSKNLPRRQLETISRWPRTLLRLPPSQCRPESPTLLLGPLQGVAPSTLLDRLAPRCRFARQPAFSHGLLLPAAPRYRSNLTLQIVT
jgi:hypothetical protein